MTPERPCERPDAVVVGAGPAGCAAAITLALAGRDVVLVDKARFPRDKCCGDGLTTGALRRLEALGVDLATLPSLAPLGSMLVRSPAGRTAKLPLARSPGLHGATARRLHLDAALVARARCAGARLLEGRQVAGLAPDGDGRRGSGDPRVTLTLSDGTLLAARSVIAADGAWSPLRRLLAVPGCAPAGAAPGEWHGFRAYMTEVGAASAGQIAVWFEPSLLPGYAWSFPLGDGAANVGVCVRRGRGPQGRTLAQRFAAVLDRPFLASLLGPNAEPEGPIRSWPIPTGTRPALLSALEGRVLFAGDAAHGADPMSGEGIAQALEMGIAAGHAVASGGSRAAARNHEVAAAYAESLRDLVVDHRLSSAARRALSKGATAGAALRVACRSEATREAAARFIFDDRARSALFDVARWPGLWRAFRHGDPPGPGPFAGISWDRR